MSNIEVKSKARLTEIDLLRFTAAMVVLLFHYTFRGVAVPAENLSPIGIPALAPIFKYGYFGVHLFFMISGFVILMTALSKTLKEFVISRITRLYPAFWFCCTLTFLVTLVMGSGHYAVTLKQYLINMTMLSGFVKVEYVDAVYWTLGIEMRFYFLIFLIMLFKQLPRIQFLLGAWLLASFFLFFYPIRLLQLLLISQYSTYFIAGATCYLIYREGNSLYKTVLLIGSFVLALFCAHADTIMIQNKFYASYDFRVVASLIATFYGILFLIANGKTAWLSSCRWRLLGILTYPLYLIHENIGFMLFYLWHPYVNHALLIIGVTVFMLFAAYFIHKRVEQPLAKWLQVLLGRILGS